MNFCGKRSDLPFPRQSDRKKEKSVVSFTREQNIICSQTQLDAIVHWQTIICKQLFAGHVVGSRPMKRKKNWHRKFNPCYFRIVSRGWVKLLYCLKIIVSDLQPDIRLIRTPHDYGQAALSLVKQSPYIFSKFNSLNTNFFYGSLSVRVNGV